MVRPVRDVTPDARDGEERLEQSLRPATFEEYVGQEKLVALARAATPGAVAAGAGQLEQLQQALVGLGFKAAQAQAAAEALREEGEGKHLDELLREALKLLRS